MLEDLRREECGMTSVEYALLVALIALAAVGVWQGLCDTSEASVRATPLGMGGVGG